MGIFVLLSSPLAVAQSPVEMESVVFLDELDLGLEGASVSPDGKTVLAHGAESAIFVIESEAPENNSKSNFILSLIHI